MKRMLKYVLFTFLLFLMCGINVKAETATYLECEYKNRDSKGKYDAVRIIYKNQGSEYFSMEDIRFRKASNQKWAYTADKITGLSSVKSCPKSISADGSNYDSSKSNSYDIESLTCTYRNSNGKDDSLDISVSKYGTNYASLKCQENKKSYDCVDEAGPWQFKWQDFTKKWYFIQKFSNGCPNYYFSYYSEGVPPLVSDFFYTGFAFDNTKNVHLYNNLTGSAASGNSRFEISSSKLVCPEDAQVTDIIQGFYDTYDSSIAALKKLSSKDEETIKQECKAWQGGDKCDAKKLSEYIKKQKTLAMAGNVDEVLQTMESTGAKEFQKLGCDSSSNTFKKFQENIKAKEKERQSASDAVMSKFDKMLTSGDKKAMEEEDKKSSAATEKLLADIYKDISEGVAKLTSGKNNQLSCPEIFGKSCEEDKLSVMCFITTIFDLLKYLVPVFLILFGSFDLGKVVVLNDKEAMPKAVSTFVTRVIIACVIFLLPTLVTLLLSVLNDAYSVGDVIDCVIGSL